MAKKDKKILIPVIGAVLLLAIVGGLLYYFTVVHQSDAVKRNGYWDTDTQTCWSSKDHPPGIAYPADEANGDLSMCCFDIEGSQIDCRDSTKLLGPILQQEFITIDGVPIGSGGTYYMAAVITFTNDPASGGADIDSLYISGLNWNGPIPGTGFLQTAWGIQVGPAFAAAVPLGTSVDFSTTQLDLRDIAGPSGAPYVYDLELTAIGSAFGGELVNTLIYTKTISVEEETLGFSVDIAWGLT